MGLTPIILEKINPALSLTFRCAKFAWKLTAARTPLAVLEKFAVFAVGDINNKTKLSLAWLAVSLIAGKIKHKILSDKANQKVIDADFNKNKASFPKLTFSHAVTAGKDTCPNRRAHYGDTLACRRS